LLGVIAAPTAIFGARDIFRGAIFHENIGLLCCAAGGHIPPVGQRPLGDLLPLPEYFFFNFLTFASLQFCILHVCISGIFNEKEKKKKE
jgi:hypothetical protein